MNAKSSEQMLSTDRDVQDQRLLIKRDINKTQSQCKNTMKI